MPPVASVGVRPHRAQHLVIQDDRIPVARYGTWGWIEEDATAEDGSSIHLPNTHVEWCCQWGISPRDLEPDTRYEVWARIRVDKQGVAGPAFWAGIYDTVRATELGHIEPAVRDIADSGWHRYRLGTVVPARGEYVWCGPRANPDNVGGVWLDSIELIALR